ncbi:MAG: alkaline phosphatase family protein [Candidatus Acidiferrales bacterium]
MPFSVRARTALCLLGLLLWTAALAAAAEAPAPPKLIVVVVVDQLRADYLTRFRDSFGADGFNRLLREGAWFDNCFYPYAVTETGPGHATLATGATPDRHGIAGNTWYDFEKQKVVESIEDEEAPVVGSASGIAGVSPRNLRANSLSDELKLATAGQARVFGISLKDRAAVLSTGHAASGAYWYERQTGKLATSRYYREALPAWLERFNAEHGAESYYGREWKSGEEVYLRLGNPGGRPDRNFYSEFRFTPFGNDLLVALAEQLVEEEKLGADSVTDFLFIGFSANDYVGHRWGPYSPQVADMTRRTDAQIAALLGFLDAKIGAGNYWFVVSADHGVAPTLAQARERGLAAENVDVRAAQQAVEAALTSRWGEGPWLVPGAEVTFNRETLRKHSVGVAQAAHLAGGVLLGVDGIRGYVAGEEARLDPKLTESVRRSEFRLRSPDVFVLQEPFALFDGDRGGTTHGTPYSYDTHVPLIFYGPAFRAGRYSSPVSPADLAPTLAAALGINPPALTSGRVLRRALRTIAAPSR